MPMTPSPLAAAVLALGLFVLGGCADDVTGPATITRAQLEEKVAESYPPQDEATTVEVSCDGDLIAEVDAVQDCEVRVDKQKARVHVRVIEVVGDDPTIESVPFVPATRVAQELLASLSDEGFHVEKVICPGELTATVGEQLTCTVVPNTGSGDVVATVTGVRGLRIDFDYEVAP